MKRRLLRFAIPAALLAAVLAGGYAYMIDCGGDYAGPPLEDAYAADGRLAAIETDLRTSVSYLSQSLGPRNPPHYAALCAAADWVHAAWRAQGYHVAEQSFPVDGLSCTNLEITIPGRVQPDEIVLVTAQYDTWPDSPGANNNGSGMAVLLELSRLLQGEAPDRTLRLVAFSVQEPPYHELGSRVYALCCRERDEKIYVMMSMDAIGIYRHEPHSQALPFPFTLFYGDRGDFLAFIADLASRPRVVAATRGFKRGSAFPIAAAAVPRAVKGAAWSDHHSFWDQGYRAIQITDTGAFRAPDSHTTSADTLEKIDFVALARVTLGMYGAIRELTTVGGD